MRSFEELLKESSTIHGHHCAGQVLGVRMAMMAPLYCLRGTEDGVRFFETALKEMEEKVRMGTGPLPEERFRFVIEGPPPWPYLRTFRDLFSKWGAVAVASTYSTVGGLWEFGFRHDANHPLESIAQHMLQWNVTNRNFLQRYQQIRRYVEEWHEPCQTCGRRR